MATGTTNPTANQKTAPMPGTGRFLSEFKALWALIAILACAVILEGGVATYHEFKMLKKVRRIAPKQMQFEREIKRHKFIGEGKIFGSADMDALDIGKNAWLEDFFENKSVDEDTAKRARQVIVMNMGRINELSIKLYNHGLTPQEGAAQITFEFDIRLRSLQKLLGKEAGKELDDIITKAWKQNYPQIFQTLANLEPQQAAGQPSGQ